MSKNTFERFLGQALNEGLKIFTEVAGQLEKEMETRQNSQSESKTESISKERIARLSIQVTQDFMKKFPQNQSAIKEQRLTKWMERYLLSVAPNPLWQSGKTFKDTVNFSLIQFRFDGLEDFGQFVREAFADEESVFSYQTGREGKQKEKADEYEQVVRKIVSDFLANHPQFADNTYLEVFIQTVGNRIRLTKENGFVPSGAFFKDLVSTFEPVLKGNGILGMSRFLQKIMADEDSVMDYPVSKAAKMKSPNQGGETIPKTIETLLLDSLAFYGYDTVTNPENGWTTVSRGIRVVAFMETLPNNLFHLHMPYPELDEKWEAALEASKVAKVNLMQAIESNQSNETLLALSNQMTEAVAVEERCARQIQAQKEGVQSLATLMNTLLAVSGTIH